MSAVTFFSIAVWTAIVFGLLIGVFRLYWRKRPFWWWLAAAFGIHILLVGMLLVAFRRVPPLLPVILMPLEAGGFMLFYESKGFSIRSTRQHSPEK
jgi:hypothetical protein